MKLWTAMIVLIAAGCAATASPGEKADVTVTGRVRQVNGVDRVPVGLFGVHATQLSEAKIRDWGIDSVRLIYKDPPDKPTQAGVGRAATWPGISLFVDCFYDRYQPALALTDADWQAKLVDYATRYAAKARGKSAHLEFWNEPYLNWSVKPGVNYDGDHYLIQEAVEGGPVKPRGGGAAYPHLVWTRGLMAVDAETGKKDYLAWGYLPREIDGRAPRAGDTYVFRKQKTMKLIEHWLVRDVTQKSYWAGKHNVELYNQMLVPFAKAAKAANPDLPIIAGWDFHIYQGNWDSWHTCFKPTIDAAIQWVDAIDEHHYGEDTLRVAASYEVAYAYTLHRYNKRLKFYNTEAGGAFDPQRPDSPPWPIASDLPADRRALGEMTYHVRDILHLLDVSPDKAVARAAHEANEPGHELAFKMLRDLRGQLIACETIDRDVWAVAAVQGDRLTVTLFNDQQAARNVKLAIAAPAGRKIIGGRVRRIEQTPGQLPVIAETPFDANTADIDLPGKRPVTLVLQLDGPADIKPTVIEQQFAADAVLSRVRPGSPVAFTVKLPAEGLKASTDARVMLALSGVNIAGTLKVNGKAYALPARQWISHVPVSPADLTGDTQLTIETTGAEFGVDAAGIVLLRK